MHRVRTNTRSLTPTEIPRIGKSTSAPVLLSAAQKYALSIVFRTQAIRQKGENVPQNLSRVDEFANEMRI